MSGEVSEFVEETPRARARDAEVKALLVITKALDKLDDAGRSRVLAFVVAQQESP